MKKNLENSGYFADVIDRTKNMIDIQNAQRVERESARMQARAEEERRYRQQKEKRQDKEAKRAKEQFERVKFNHNNIRN